MLLLVALLLPDVFEGGFFPPLLDWTWTASPDLLLQGRETERARSSSPSLVLLLAVFLTRTRIGPDGARVGGQPRQGASGRASGCSAPPSVVWAISAAFAAVAAIALAPVRGVSASPVPRPAGGALSYQLLLRALVVALLARMRSACR